MKTGGVRSEMEPRIKWKNESRDFIVSAPQCFCLPGPAQPSPARDNAMSSFNISRVDTRQGQGVSSPPDRYSSDKFGSNLRKIIFTDFTSANIFHCTVETHKLSHGTKRNFLSKPLAGQTIVCWDTNLAS